MRHLLTMLLLTSVLSTTAHAAEPLEAVQLYTQDELVKLIRKKRPFKAGQDDDCQLVQDIAARASKNEVAQLSVPLR